MSRDFDIIDSRRHGNRKPFDQLVRPGHSLSGPAIGGTIKPPKPCPMIRHLKTNGVPLFEDVAVTVDPPSLPVAFEPKFRCAT